MVRRQARKPSEEVWPKQSAVLKGPEGLQVHTLGQREDHRDSNPPHEKELARRRDDDQVPIVGWTEIVCAKCKKPDHVAAQCQRAECE